MMGENLDGVPEKLAELLSHETWVSWSDEQKKYITEHEGQPTGSISLGEGSNIRNYSEKTWELGAARPNLQEGCDKCGFEYCFYARPRNWSMRSSADVWNLLKCANVKCQSYFDSCL